MLALMLAFYSGPAGAFEVRAGAPLTIVAGGEAAALQPWAKRIFRTTHPQFRKFGLMFERRAGAVAVANWVPSHTCARGGRRAAGLGPGARQARRTLCQ